MDEQLFDKIADAELTELERRLGEVDPDDLDVELSMGVLTLTFADDSKLVVNSHRAARQIWMAAFHQAWHFDPKSDSDDHYSWRTPKDELRTTLARLLEGKLGRAIQLS